MQLAAVTKSFVATLVVAFSAVTIGAAFAPADAYPRKVRRACKYDYKRLCPRYKVGSAKMRSCMRSKTGQISPRCYDVLVRYGYGRRR